MNIFNRLSPLLQNKIALFQLSALIVLTLMIGTIGVFLLMQPAGQQPNGSATTTPTPVSGAITTSPENNAIDVGVYEPLSLHFPAPLSTTEQRQVSIVASPPILADRTWSADNKTLTLTPQTALKENQLYTLSIVSPVASTKLSFTTTSVLKTTQKEINTSGLTQQEVQQKYPWYKNLPLFTGKYFVTFDLKNETFRARLFISRPEQTDVLKKLVTQKLQTMGADTNKFKIVWELDQ